MTTTSELHVAERRGVDYYSEQDNLVSLHYMAAAVKRKGADKMNEPYVEQVTGAEISPKSRVVALLLCFLLGVLGAHRFYVGKIGTGILMLITVGGFGIWALIDLILIIVGSFKDKEGRLVFRWTEPGSM
jgi:hypothetical protein